MNYKERHNTADFGSEPMLEDGSEIDPLFEYNQGLNISTSKASEVGRVTEQRLNPLDTSSHEILLSCKGRWKFILIFAVFQTIVGF